VKGGLGWGDRIFHVLAGANVSINGVTIQGGNAGTAGGGGILNQGTLALDASAVSGSAAAGGGGILNQGTLSLNRSTVSGNTASGANGGGILNQGTLTLTNSTISGNTASSGGGIANSGAATLSSVTIAANTASPGSAGGLLNATGQTTALKNSLIADNHGAAAPDCAGALSSQGHNLVAAANGCSLSAGIGDLRNVEAQLEPLRDNGGSTLTHGLLPGSPALDAGDPAAPGSGDSACPPKDQRNIRRPQTGRCDIGAYEDRGISIVNFSFQPETLGISAGQTVRWKNLSTTVHTTHADNNNTEFWVSPDLHNGDVYLHTFSTAGLYLYHCAIHPNMTGRIFVSGPSVNKLPVLTRLNPSSAPVGSAALTLILDGTNFAEDAVVHWNNITLTPTNIANDQIIVTIPAELLATAGSAKVTVVNPGVGGGTSNALTFTIGGSGQSPVISSISPSAAAARSGPITLTINGSNFVSGATVHWGTLTLTPTLVSGTQIIVTIPAELLATAGVVSVTVVNPAPGGASNVVSFAILGRRFYLPLARR
jgi:plastocyanin